MPALILQDDERHATTPVGSLVQARHLRESQEDAVLVRGDLVAVCDGMGGHERGADASRVALEALDVCLDGPARDLDALVDAIRVAHDAVVALSDGSYESPGTCLVVIARLEDGTTAGAWVGDCRAYALSKERVTLLTKDHTDWLGYLTNYLGDPDAHPLTVETFAVADDVDQVLLCSDGLWGPVEGWVKEQGASDVETSLLCDPEQATELAKTSGTDNITGVWVNITHLF